MLPDPSHPVEVLYAVASVEGYPHDLPAIRLAWRDGEGPHHAVFVPRARRLEVDGELCEPTPLALLGFTALEEYATGGKAAREAENSGTA